MALRDVVEKLAIPILAKIKPSNDPLKTMRQRGFGWPELWKALQLISADLALSNKTADGKAYLFKASQKFISDNLDSIQPELIANITGKTKPLTDSQLFSLSKERQKQK